MKKLLVLAMAVAMGAAASAECTWSWWTNDSKAKDDTRGCALGLGVERKQVSGAEVAVCLNKADEVKAGAQVAIGYNRVNKLHNGCQVAWVNSADSAALQIGLICWNKTGFLPFFVFFNFDPKMFGNNK